jgi:hypothetical protein
MTLLFIHLHLALMGYSFFKPPQPPVNFCHREGDESLRASHCTPCISGRIQRIALDQILTWPQFYVLLLSSGHRTSCRKRRLSAVSECMYLAGMQAAIAFTSSLGNTNLHRSQQVQTAESRSRRDRCHFQGHGIHRVVTAWGSIGLVMDGH